MNTVKSAPVWLLVDAGCIDSFLVNVILDLKLCLKPTWLAAFNKKAFRNVLTILLKFSARTGKFYSFACSNCQSFEVFKSRLAQLAPGLITVLNFNSLIKTDKLTSR